MQLAFEGMRAPIHKNKKPGNRRSDPAHFPKSDGSTQMRLVAPTPTTTSPIGYIGGKGKAWKYVKAFLPKGLREAASPFVGGASIELRLAASGVRVHAADNFWYLVNFWQHFLRDPKALADLTLTIYPIGYDYAKDMVLGNALRELPSDALRAAYFWGLNKMSWCGKTMQSFGLSADPTSHTYFENPRWEDWRNDYITIEHRDYRDMMDLHTGKFMYLDPPYIDKEHYYGKVGEQEAFDHDEFADRLKRQPGDWILSYGNHPRIWELYANYHIIVPAWQYSSRSIGGAESVNTSSELLIIKNPPPSSQHILNRLGTPHANYNV